MNFRETSKRLLSLAALIMLISCAEVQSQVVTYPGDYPDVPKSDRYSISLIDSAEQVQESVVFKNSCNPYDPNSIGNRTTDYVPLLKFKDRTIHWTHFSFEEAVTVEVTFEQDISGEELSILPSRFGVEISKVDAHTARFTLTQPGQYSVEVGEDGYKNGLLVFADPLESDIPTVDSSWAVLESVDQEMINSISSDKTAIYFKGGVHDVGVYQVPANIKEIYLEGDAWVYGAFVMSGAEDSGVKIYGRGVLSAARLNLRESHSIEAKNGANAITVNGVVIADYVFFAIRLLGRDNVIDWAKIVGGWIFNCDGIAAYANSKISNCFIWANDDTIKVYDDNITVDNVVCWQLDNGGVIQLNWGKMRAHNCRVSNLDLIHCDWDSDRENNGVISCRTAGGANSNFLFENITVEQPVTHIFRLSPQGDTPHPIENFTFKNWNVKMDMSLGMKNYLEGSTPESPIKGLVFDNFVINGERLTQENMVELGAFSIKNCEEIIVK